MRQTLFAALLVLGSVACGNNPLAPSRPAATATVRVRVLAFGQHPDLPIADARVFTDISTAHTDAGGLASVLVRANQPATISVEATGWQAMSATGSVAPGSHEVWSYWLQANPQP